MPTKRNPGTYDCYAKLADDEPYFVLRAKDPIARRIVRIWASFATLGGHEIEKAAAAVEIADDMALWRSKQ